jgi:RNA polymerase sigma-70 factor (ECF subfamily)
MDRLQIPTSGPLPTSIIESIRCGDHQIWSSLHAKLEPSLTRIATQAISGRIRSKIEASDLVQDTFLIAHRSAAGFRGTHYGEVFSWVRQILVNRINRLGRELCFTQKRAIHREFQLDSFAHREALVQAKELPCDYVQIKEEQEILNRTYKCLSDSDKQLIHERLFNEASYPELAIRFEKSEIALRKQWSRAIDRWSRLVKGL